MTGTTLHCDDGGSSVTVTAEVQHPPLVAESTRTIEGIVLPWDEFGRTNNGAMKFSAGGINLPEDITRVKLLAGHSPNGIPVGHATAWESTREGLKMTFKFGSGADADRALTAAAEHVIDAFSIEAYGIEKEGTTVKAAALAAVALVPMPAFANARVATVLASAPAPDGQQSSTDDDEDTDDQDTNSTSSDDDEDTDKEKSTTVDKSLLQPGVMPGTTNSNTTTEVHASLDDVMNFLTGCVRGDAAAELKAELTDITDASTMGRNAPQWLGELWNGVTYTRRVIPLLTTAPLTSRKAVGYKWVTKPGVDKYSGNKAEIPSKGASIEQVERDAQRWAGGNDLDRVFWDFKETEFLNAYWRAMAESYAFETDQEAGKFLVDEASVIDGGADNIIHAVARGSIAIDNELHTPASFVLINPNDYEQILQLTNLDAPKYLDLVPATDPKKWVTSQFVPAGTAILGTKSAVTHYELGGSPLRVEAEHIAKGGRDAALFGYTALMVNRPEGLRSIKFGTPTEPVAG